MFVETLCCALFGVFAGIFTGLTPGIHINLVSLIVVSISPLLLNYFSALSLCVFIIAMAITHTFLDALPSVYLGAPDESQVLNVLPCHRMLLQGEGHNALKLTLIGSISCLMLCMISIPILIKIMDVIYPLIKDYIGHALIVIMAYMILKEKGKRKIKALLMFMMSGVLGLVVFSIFTLKQPLFPLLSGLFGVSLLLMSIFEKTNIPEQDTTKPLKIETKVLATSTMAGTFVATIAGFLPGLGGSQAAIIGQQIVGDIGEKGFIIMTSGINAANMMASIATSFVLEKARNGAIVAVNDIIGIIDAKAFILFLIVIIFTTGIACILALKISKAFSRYITRINYTALVISIIAFITILTFYFDGLIGLLILITSASIGLISTKINIGKNHLMGCLILPVICYFMI